MQTVAIGFLIAGVTFIVLAGVGLYRMPTFFMRLQATSKASTLGVIFMCIGASILLPSTEAVLKSLLICVFLLLTTPVATHALALAAKDRGNDR